MIKKILETIKENDLIEMNDKIILGLSGGADSVSLFYILLELKEKFNLSLSCVHVNHGIRGEEALSDQNFCKRICEKNKINLDIYNVDIEKEAKVLGITTEEAGRKFRYKAFNESLEKLNFNKIAVAHNKNDNAETVLMRIIRGTGPKGLGGIPHKNNNIIRPLLDIKREEIENYLDKKNLDFVLDKTNQKTIYTRNKIRLELIPYLRDNFNQNIIDSIINLSQISSKEDAFLDNITKKAYEESVTENENINISIEKMRKFDDVIKRRVVRQALKNFNVSLKDIEYIHMENILELLNKETGKVTNLPCGIFAEKSYNEIKIYKKSFESKPFSYKLSFDKLSYIKEINQYISLSFKPIHGFNKLTNVYTKAFSYDKINDVVEIRTRRQGDKIRLKGVSGNKKLKSLFIDKKIPKEKRDSIPLLADGFDILYIFGDIKRESSFYTDFTENEKIFYVQVWEEQ